MVLGRGEHDVGEGGVAVALGDAHGRHGRLGHGAAVAAFQLVEQSIGEGFVPGGVEPNAGALLCRGQCAVLATGDGAHLLARRIGGVDRQPRIEDRIEQTAEFGLRWPAARSASRGSGTDRWPWRRRRAVRSNSSNLASASCWSVRMCSKTTAELSPGPQARRLMAQPCSACASALSCTSPSRRSRRSRIASARLRRSAAAAALGRDGTHRSCRPDQLDDWPISGCVAPGRHYASPAECRQCVAHACRCALRADSTDQARAQTSMAALRAGAANRMTGKPSISIAAGHSIAPACGGWPLCARIRLTKRSNR